MPHLAMVLSDEKLSSALTEALHSFNVATIVSFFLIFFAWNNGFFNGIRQIARTDPPSLAIDGLAVARGFGLFFIMQLFVAPLIFTYLLLPSFDVNALRTMTERQMGYFQLVMILGSSAGVFFAFFTLKRSQQILVWGPSPFSFSNLLLGIKSWIVAFPLVNSVAMFFSFLILFFFQQGETDQLPVAELKKLMNDPWQLLMMAFAIVGIVPIAEELLFRGFLQSWLRNKIGSQYAILITAAIFSFFHASSSQGLFNIELLAAIFVLACFLGVLYEKQRSIWASIGLHAFFNGISAIMIII